MSTYENIQENNLDEYLTTVGIFGERNYFNLKLASLLESKHCRTIIFGERDKIEKLRVNYLIFSELKNLDVSLDRKLNIKLTDFGYILDLSERNKTKTLFLFDIFLNKNQRDYFNQIKEIVLKENRLYAAILLLGDLLDIESKNKEVNVFSNFLNLNIKKKHLNLIARNYYFPEDSNEVYKNIIRTLFSLSGYGKVNRLISKPLTKHSLLQIINKFFPHLKINLLNFEEEVVREGETKIISGDLESGLKKLSVYASNKLNLLLKEGEANNSNISKSGHEFQQTTRYIETKPRVGNHVHKYINKNKLLNMLIPKSYKGVIKELVLLFIIIFMFPAALLFIGLTNLYLAKNFLIEKEVGSPRLSFEASINLFDISSQYSAKLVHIPYVGEYFLFTEKTGTVLQRITLLLLKQVTLYKYISESLDNLSSESKLDEQVVNNIYLELDLANKDLGFLEAEIKDNNFVNQIINNLLLGDQSLKDLRNKLYLFKEIVGLADQIFAASSTKSYLVVTQNDNILRPGGGRLVTLGVIKFSNWKLVENNYYEPNYIDNNLKGEVVPPYPLKKYLNQERWLVEDANWSLDFPSSASRMGWFVDKSIDEKIDGVVSINYSFLENIVSKKENLIRPKTDKTSLDDKEDNHFEKSKYLLTHLFSDLKLLDQKSKVDLITDLYNGLSDKQIQIFNNNTELTSVLADLGWDGSINKPDCGQNCYADLVAINESTIEGGLADKIIRQASLEVSIEENIIKRKLVYYLYNQTGSNYRAYFRTLVPQDAGFSKVEILGNNSKETLDPEMVGYKNYKEAGLFLDLPNNFTKAIILSWESGTDLKKDVEGEYILSWKKQSGVNKINTEIKVNTASKLPTETLPTYGNLTEDGTFVYNTPLTRDFTSRIFWENE